MKKLLIIFLFAISLVSCQKSDNKKLKTTDEIVKILGYITDEDSPQNTCGYNGIIELKLKEGFMNMEFNTGENCNRIVYTYQDLLFSKKISPDGISYLNKLIKK